MTHPNEVVDALGPLVFEDKLSASAVLVSLKLQAQKYGFITVAKLKELLDHGTIYADYRWGWQDLSDFSVTQYEGEGARENDHQLNYPEPVQM